MTLIQSLPASIGLDVDQMRLLDAFRVKRNSIDYSGEAVDGAWRASTPPTIWRSGFFSG